MNLNIEQLIRTAVVGEISHPTLRKTGYVITADGKAEVYPSVGGITYNCRIGDSATRWMADHVEPGVSIRNNGPSVGEYSPNAALNVLACIGNKATVLTGNAKGSTGFVTGKHGGVEHVLVDFEPEVLEQLTIGDRIQVNAFGVGLRLMDHHPDILAMNIDPNLLQKMDIQESGGYLTVGVTHIIPAYLMGAGLGVTSTHSGDYDIQLFDTEAIKEYELDSLRFGDIVAIMDSDASYGWIYHKGAVSIGVVVHSSSVISGHGPGVTTVLTSRKGKIKPVVNKEMNLKTLLYE